MTPGLSVDEVFTNTRAVRERLDMTRAAPGETFLYQRRQLPLVPVVATVRLSGS